MRSLLLFIMATATVAMAQPPAPTPSLEQTELDKSVLRTDAPAAAITGKEAANVHELVVLDSTGSVGATTVWVWDKAGYGFDVLECSGKLAFAPPTPGRYVFWLVAASEGRVAVAAHAVVVGGKVPIDDGGGGTGGDEGGDAAFDEAVEAMAARYTILSTELNDPPTAKNIAAEWRAVSGAVRGSPDMATVNQHLRGAFEKAMAARTGLSRYVDWLNGFRVPLNKDLELLQAKGLLDTPARVDTLIQAVARAISG